MYKARNTQKARRMSVYSRYLSWHKIIFQRLVFQFIGPIKKFPAATERGDSSSSARNVVDGPYLYQVQFISSEPVSLK